jgi:hypothetical protein
MTDHLMVPVEVVEQFTPTTSLELDVWFDAYDNGVNRASMLGTSGSPFFLVFPFLSTFA